MGKELPHLKFYATRCTLLAVHALAWPFLWQSVPEFRQTSQLPDDVVDRRLKDVIITGSVFLALTAVMTLTGLTLHSISFHFLFIAFHALGTFLTAISILNYWDVLLLWIPCSITCIFPFVIELIYAILTCAGLNQHF